MDNFSTHFKKSGFTSSKIICSDKAAKTQYKLELWEDDDIAKDSEYLFLFIPGFFQNPSVFHLTQEISFWNYLKAKTNGSAVFLCVRGIGDSDDVSNSTIDDIALYDIPQTIQSLNQKYPKKKIIPIGHSQGAIALQVSFGGLCTKEGERYFSEKVASERIKTVHSLGLLAGNLSMDSIDGHNKLLAFAVISPLIWTLSFIWRSKVSAKLLTSFVSPVWQRKVFNIPIPLSGNTSLSRSAFWEFLISRKDLSNKTLDAMYWRTFEATYLSLIHQFAIGTKNKGLSTKNGIRYFEALKNLDGRISQLCFSEDSLSYPKITKTDSFDKIKSRNKNFFELQGFGHEDFLFRPEKYYLADPFIESLVAKT